MTTLSTLPLPTHYRPDEVADIRLVNAGEIANQAAAYAKAHGVKPAAGDRVKRSLMMIDEQIDFCSPQGSLFVGGRSGTGAVDDARRLLEWAYINLGSITEMCASMDTHKIMQIFHPQFWSNEQGEHPAPFTMISVDEVEKGIWQVNPGVFREVEGADLANMRRFVEHYVRQLAATGKYALTIWPYHTLLGSVGHALLPSVQELCVWHSVARNTQTQYEIKGGNTLTENYSVLGPEVRTKHDGSALGQKNTKFIERLLAFDAVIIAGQAKSHCVAWTIDDLLNEIMAQDPTLAKKVYLLEDCTSPVVVPGVVDYTDEANAAFQRFADAGMHVVNTSMPLETWPDMPL